MTDSAKPKLIYLVTEDWYFYSHRLPMARAAQRAGFDVAVITNVKDHRAKIEQENIRVIPLSLERRNLNPLQAVKHIAQLIQIYKQEHPSVVHHIAMKPVLYGAIAAWIAAVPHVINAFAGLGFVFTAQSALAKILRTVLIPIFRVLLKRPNSVLLLQNPDDREVLDDEDITPRGDATVIIRGSGVDIKHFAPQSFPPVAPDFICAYAGRMIAIKGLETLKEAFALLYSQAPHIKLHLYGQPDPANPQSWSAEKLRQWEAENPNVRWCDFASDMATVWKNVHLALQASYGGEGIPKSLLEAAACGRTIVASDVAGCREVVEENVNGILVPPHDAKALVDAILSLASDPQACRQMGLESRKIVESDLSAEAVSTQTETLYRRFLKLPLDTGTNIEHIGV
jgi:glycosyltransferase involved in cell wall biosynthesis